MIRTLLIIAGLFAIAAGFEWLKDTPGELALTVGGTVYSVGLAQAALAVAILAVVSIIAYLILRTVWTAPGKALFAWRDRKVERGRMAISEGLMAIAAGDLRRAELAAREALKRAPGAPLTALLQAQAAQLKGDRDAARDTFTAMLDSPTTRIAGLHGLFVEAERQGAAEAAHHYAQTAYEARPDTAWAVRALLRFQAGAGDWDAALATLARAADNRSIDKKTARDHRAVLLTAKAMACEDTDTVNAKQAALEAHQLSPGLAPAAIVAGRILARLGEIKRAAKVLEASWKAAPHPELAEAYAHVRSGDSALDRMARMDRLAKMKPHHDEGRMALAAMAIEAREWQVARDALKPIITTRPTRNALILMAELDEAEHGDRGRVREWLDRAVRAPRDPVWTADGLILEEWAPVSPATGRIGAVEWKLPVDEGETRLSIDMDDEAFKPRDLLPLAAVEAAVPETEDVAEAEDVVEAAIIDVTPASKVPEAAAEPQGEVAAEPEPALQPDAADAPAAGAEPDGAAAPEPAPEERPPDAPEPRQDAAVAKAEIEEVKAATGAEGSGPAANGRAHGEAAAAVAGEAANDDGPETPVEASVEAFGEPTVEPAVESPAEPSVETSAEEPDEEPIMPHIPDDPGVDDSEEPEPRRFRLF